MTEFDDVVPALRDALQKREYLTLTPVQSAVLSSKIGDADALVEEWSWDGPRTAQEAAKVAAMVAGTITILHTGYARLNPEQPKVTRDLTTRFNARLDTTSLLNVI